MIKVAHFINDLGVAGAEVMLYKTVTHMNEQSFSSIVISLSEKGPIGERIEQAGIKVIALNEKVGVPSPKIVWQLRNILITHKIPSNPFWTSL